MQPTNINLSDQQHQLLQVRAREEGVSEADLVRRILDEELGLESSPCASAAADGLWSGCSGDELAALQRWLSVDHLEGLGPQ